MANTQATLLHLLTEVYTKILAVKLPGLSAAEMQRLANTAASIAAEHIRAHPYMAGLTAIQLGLAPVLGAGWLTAPLLQAVGFGPLGPIAGSAATWYQATWLGAYIPAGSLFSLLQRWATVL